MGLTRELRRVWNELEELRALIGSADAGEEVSAPDAEQDGGTAPAAFNWEESEDKDALEEYARTLDPPLEIDKRKSVKKIKEIILNHNK
jgi:hypothetical protein